MLTRFFIDRPIFATVLSIAIALTGAIALFTLPIAQYPQITPPGVQVSIQYPGASAQVVADTVAAPIEQQVNGIDHMLYISSQSGNDGSYTLIVTFEIGTDTDTALVMVQNRVALAMQQLPTAVQNQGILIRKKTPDILMVVNFYSPNGQHDDVFLSNYATINVKDELLRIEGVSDITYLGERDYSIRAWLDPQKLASLNMTANDVANAVLEPEPGRTPPAKSGQPPASRKQSMQLPIDTLGRLTETEQFGDIIIKATPGQQPTQNSVSAPNASSNYGLPAPIGINALPNPGSTTNVGVNTGQPATSATTSGGGGTAAPVPPVMIPTTGGGNTSSGPATPGTSGGPAGLPCRPGPAQAAARRREASRMALPRRPEALRRPAAHRTPGAPRRWEALRRPAELRRHPAAPRPVWRATWCSPIRLPASVPRGPQGAPQAARGPLRQPLAWCRSKRRKGKGAWSQSLRVTTNACTF